MARKYTTPKRSSAKAKTKRPMFRKTKSSKRPRRTFKLRRRVKKTSLYQGVKQLATFHSISSYNYGTRRMNFKDRVFDSATHGNWSSVTQDKIKSLVGRQECGDAVILDRDDVEDLKTQISTYMQSGFGNVQMNTLRFLIKHFRMRYELKNFAKDTAYVDIYDCAPRRDINIDDNGPGNYPAIAFQQGIKDQVKTPDSSMYLKPGQTPFDSNQFNTWWKVVKVTRVILSPGGTHEHIVSGRPNYMFNQALRTGSSGNALGYKGLTTSTLFVVRGSIGLGDDATPTYENAEIAIIGSKQVEYAFINTPANVTQNLYTLAQTLFTGSNIINPNTSELDSYATLT